MKMDRERRRQHKPCNLCLLYTFQVVCVKVLWNGREKNKGIGVFALNEATYIPIKMCCRSEREKKKARSNRQFMELDEKKNLKGKWELERVKAFVDAVKDYQKE